MVPAGGDIDALTDAIDGLIDGPGERARWAAAGAARATAFTWAASATAHRRAYEAALAVGPTGAGLR